MNVWFANLDKPGMDSDRVTNFLWFQREPEPFADPRWRRLLSGVNILLSKKDVHHDAQNALLYELNTNNSMKNKVAKHRSTT